MSEAKPWKTLSSDVVFEADVFKIRRDTCLLPDGTIKNDVYVRESPDVAIICCLTKSREVVLVRQFRQGVGEVTIELPADRQSRHDRSVEDTARRELLEETGYSSEVFERCATWFSNAPADTARVTVFLAPSADRVAAPRGTPGEATEVLLVSLPEFRNMLKDGRLKSVVQVAAAHHVLAALAEKATTPTA